MSSNMVTSGVNESLLTLCSAPRVQICTEVLIINKRSCIRPGAKPSNNPEITIQVTFYFSSFGWIFKVQQTAIELCQMKTNIIDLIHPICYRDVMEPYYH